MTKTHKVKCGNGWKVYPANLFSGMPDDFDPYCCGSCERTNCGYKPEKDGPLCPREIESGKVLYEKEHETIDELVFDFLNVYEKTVELEKTMEKSRIKKAKNEIQ